MGPRLPGRAREGRSRPPQGVSRARPGATPEGRTASNGRTVRARSPERVRGTKSSADQHRSPERVAPLAAAACQPGGLPGALPEGELISETASRLDAFSGYPFRAWLAGRAVGRQPGHQRPVRPGPLVLGVDLLNSPAPTEDRDRTVSRRSEPSSRTALNGEQPYPWDRLQPQDAMSRHRGAKPCRRCGLLGKISLLSPEYLLSVERRPSHVGPPDH